MRRGTPPLTRLVSTEDDFLAMVRKWNGRRDIYAGAGARRAGRKGGAASVASVSAWAIDVDSKAGVWEDALAVADEVTRWFERNGFARPVRVASGGGIHLWFAFPHVTFESAASRRDFASRLKTFVHEVASAVGSSGTAEVDTSIHDLPRILRVPGTRNVKRGGIGTRALDDMRRREDASVLAFIRSRAPSGETTAPRRASKGPTRRPHTVTRPTPLTATHRGLKVLVPPRSLHALLRSERRPGKRGEYAALLRGSKAGHRSGSEAEAALAQWLAWSGYPDALISEILTVAAIKSDKSGAPKWANASGDYRARTLRAARAGKTRWRFDRFSIGAKRHEMMHGSEGDSVLLPPGTAESALAPILRKLNRVEGVAARYPDAYGAQLDATVAEARALHTASGAGGFADAPSPAKPVGPSPPARTGGVRFTIHKPRDHFVYGPEDGVTVALLTARLRSTPRDVPTKNGTPVCYRAVLMRVPRRSKARPYLRASQANDAVVYVGRGGVPGVTSERSGYAVLKAALALSHRADRPALPCYVVLWRRGSARGAWFDAYVTRSRKEARAIAEMEEREAIVRRVWPGKWERFVLRREQRARAAKRKAIRTKRAAAAEGPASRLGRIA